MIVITGSEVCSMKQGKSSKDDNTLRLRKQSANKTTALVIILLGLIRILVNHFYHDSELG